MRLFLDTEFTTLAPGNKLISIALVDEDENYFYAELTDTYELSDCSDFVKSDVLPYLKNSHKMTHTECSFAIANWIEDRNVLCMIASDAPTWDLPFLFKLLEPLWPDNLTKAEIFPVSISSNVEKEWVSKLGLDIHNALDDALVMKKGTLGY
jgi:hypothetical protein